MRVHTEESWTGAPVGADTANLQAALDASLHAWVNNPKHRSESHPDRGSCASCPKFPSAYGR
ncbi:hypothetical protein ABZS88_28225 [Streptomyces sp. NPDC005480]|uniref:hypothetical protein n=1 Tax=Streptomyces sp. NPDC005480 TaxID=3154880 RepID=UPI0033A4F202